MAAPSVTSLMKMKWPGADSQMIQFKTNLWDTVADTNYTSRTGSVENIPLPKPGVIRRGNDIIGAGEYERVWCDGPCWFQWVLNRSGATLEQYSLVSRPAPTTGLSATGGTVNTIVDAGLVADELTHGVVTITAAGGAAPLDESAYIIENTDTTVYVQPDFTTAVANTDTYAVYFPFNIEDAAAGDEASEVRGVVLRADGVEDNYWGWVLFKGRVWVATSAALVQDQAIIAGTANVSPSSTSALNLHVGWAPLTVSAAAPNAMVELSCGAAAEGKCVSG